MMAGLALVAAAASAQAQSAPLTPTPPPAMLPEAHFNPDGSVQIDKLVVPFSAYASDEAQAGWRQAHDPKAAAPPALDLPGLQALYGRFNDELAARMKALYPVTIEAKTIGGVRTEIIRPKAGVAPENARRVLINLHGGGFLWGEGSGGEVEAIPIASVGKVTVITVAYRQGPEHHFPAGSEDVAAVYKALLADHKPGEIGIYGCSAGGILTAQATAWILTHGMPAPGAIGTFCGSAAPVSGDSMAFNQAVTADFAPKTGAPYLGGVDWKDPLVAPVNSPELLAKFPPTLLIAGGRDFTLSSLFYTQRRMTAAGVTAELHVWDGLPHAFFMNPDLPESREAYDVIAKFFARNLAR